MLVIDPETRRLRNTDDLMGLSDARLMQPQQVADWLARWARK